MSTQNTDVRVNAKAISMTLSKFNPMSAEDIMSVIMSMVQ